MKDPLKVTIFAGTNVKIIDDPEPFLHTNCKSSISTRKMPKLQKNAPENNYHRRVVTSIIGHTFGHGHGSLLPLLLCLVPHVLSHLNGTVAHLLGRIIVRGYGALRVQLYMIISNIEATNYIQALLLSYCPPKATNS